MPPDSQSNTGMMMLGALTAKSGGSNLGAMAGDLLGVKSSGALFVGVLGSRTVQDRLIERFVGRGEALSAGDYPRADALQGEIDELLRQRDEIRMWATSDNE